MRNRLLVGAMAALLVAVGFGAGWVIFDGNPFARGRLDAHSLEQDVADRYAAKYGDVDDVDCSRLTAPRGVWRCTVDEPNVYGTRVVAYRVTTDGHRITALERTELLLGESMGY